MANKRPKPEEIVSKLRQVEVLCGKGMPRLDAFRQVQITEQTFYRWRKQYGGMDASLIARMKELDEENKRLKRMYAEKSMQNDLLKEALGSEIMNAAGLSE